MQVYYDLFYFKSHVVYIFDHKIWNIIQKDGCQTHFMQCICLVQCEAMSEAMSEASRHNHKIWHANQKVVREACLLLYPFINISNKLTFLKHQTFYLHMHQLVVYQQTPIKTLCCRIHNIQANISILVNFLPTYSLYPLVQHSPYQNFIIIIIT